MKGAVARCSLGAIGLITSDAPQEVDGDGRKGMAWVGVHMTDKLAPVGSPWSSRNPTIILKSIMDVIHVEGCNDDNEKYPGAD